MHTITTWSAKRAGTGITITGRDSSGAAVKLVGIREITGGPDGTIAIHKDGARYKLA
jgi:hypothetical protein